MFKLIKQRDTKAVSDKYRLLFQRVVIAMNHFLLKQKHASMILSVSLCLCGGFSDAHAAGTLTLTLDKALSLAMDKNRDIEKAREYARLVQGKYIEERSAALPQFGLNGGLGVSQDQSLKASMGAAPRQNSGTLDLTLSQPLYTWGKLNAAIRAAEVGLKTADQQLRLYRQIARRDVSTAWYDILLARELNRLARENQAQKQRHLDEARKKFSAGVATDYDVLAAEVASANARPEVIRTENAIRSYRERLRFLLDSEDEVDVAGTLQPYDHDISVPDLAADLALARTKRPELNDLRLRIGIYRELVTIADAENKPRLDLKGGLGWHWLSLNDPGPARDADGAAWNVGVFLTFPFFDGLKTSGKVMQAKSDLATQQLEEQKLLDSVALELRDARYALAEAGEICRAMAGTVTQADRLLRMAEKGFEFGVKTRLDVEDAQLNLLQANSSLARALRDYRVAKVTYEWAMGTLGE